jgi:multiple sugar transport system permease protein
LGKASYVGFENYAKLFQDGDFWNSLWVTIQYVLWNIPIQTVLAMIVALLSLVVLDPAIGLRSLNFLTTTELAMPFIACVNTWKFMGYTALIIFAGLQGIPREIDEAAMIDGAAGWTAFRKITLPLLRPVLAFVVITSVIGSFQVYDTVAVATRGGPVNATWVMNFFIYKNAFESYRMGYATAASITATNYMRVLGLIDSETAVKLGGSGQKINFFGFVFNSIVVSTVVTLSQVLFSAAGPYVSALMAPALLMTPFAVFFLRQFFLGINRELEEAAFLDGAGKLRTSSRSSSPSAAPRSPPSRSSPSSINGTTACGR